jgi:hypothetical protein
MYRLIGSPFNGFDHRKFKGGSAPPPPDPYATSAAQTQSNKDTATYNAATNNGNTYTPWGNSTFTPRTDPNTGATTYDQTVTLDPTQQKLLDVQNQQDLSLGNLSNALVDQAGAAYSKPIDTSGLPAIQSAPDAVAGGYKTSVDTNGLPQLLGANDMEGARKQIQDALYQRQASYLDPQYQQREQQLQSRLAAQGITQNSEAWNNSLDELNRARSFDYGQARDQAITGGLGEMTGLAGIASNNRGQLYGERSQDANLNNTAYSQQLSEALQRMQGNNAARSQGLNEQFALREAPMNELNALRSATAVDQPQFDGAAKTSAAPTDVSGNINNNYQQRLNIWNANQQSSNGLMSGLMGMAGSVGGAALMVF